MKKLLLLFIVIIMLTGCYKSMIPAEPITSDVLAVDNVYKEIDEIEEKDIEKEIEKETEVELEIPKLEEVPEEYKELPQKIVYEGEKVSFPNLQATDPDGDPIKYTFTTPLDAQGEWQTKKGDAGNYKVTITASDGKNEVSQDVLIIVKKPNNYLPKIEEIDTIIVDEGEEIELNPIVVDEDNDEIKITVSGWMKETKYKTNYEDSGDHKIIITASDGKNMTSIEVDVIVRDVNRVPIIDPIGDVVIKEYDKIIINATAEDLDGDEVKITYSDPLDKNGEWKTTKGDSGKYRVVVTANDGKDKSDIAFYIIVEKANTAPIIEVAEKIEVDEGDLIKIDYDVRDLEGNKLDVRISGWITSDVYQTTSEDAGTHKVTIRASDGEQETVKEITIKVNDKNQVPVFNAGAFN